MHLIFLVGVLKNDGDFEITAHWSFDSMEPFKTATGVLAWFIIHKPRDEAVTGAFAFKYESNKLGGKTLSEVVAKFIPSNFGLTSLELLKHFKDDFAIIYSNAAENFTLLESSSNQEYKKLFGPDKLFSSADNKKWEILSGNLK